MARTILLIGAFDVKGQEYAFVRRLIEAQGCRVLTMNVGVLGETELFPIDIQAEAVAAAGGGDLEPLRAARDRGAALEVMSRGAADVARRLYSEGAFHGVLAMGGSGGTGVAAAAMRALPIGVPKVIVSTLAAGDTASIVGTKDITLIPSVADVAGVNSISEKIFRQAAGAICGMCDPGVWGPQPRHDAVRAPSPVADHRRDARHGGQAGATHQPIITASMFGNTTACVDRCRELLSAKGYEVLVFHSVGSGGRTMESLVEEGLVAAVLDITTTEWADELCGGVFSAGNGRLDAPGKAGVPHLIAPGCLDMVNFGPRETVPPRYQDRKLYVWSPTVTLMRTNVEENARLGEILARKANAARGRVGFLLPLKGMSMLDSPGGRFWWPEADRALFDAIKTNLNPGIPVVELDCNINDEVFADRAVQMLLEMIPTQEH